MKKKRRKNSIAKDVVIVVCITLLGCGVLFIGGKPLYKVMKAEFIQSMVNGQQYSDTSSGTGTESNGDGEDALVSTQSPFGKIACEAVSLDVPLYYGDTESHLLYGAGMYPGGCKPGEQGTTLISAHDLTYFKPLENISEGDVIEITTRDERFRYSVRKIQVQKVDDGLEFYENENVVDKHELVLYTCYPFGASAANRDERFFVYCDYIPQ